MKKNTLIKTVGIVIIICCVAAISYLVGRLNAPDVNTKTFYATVESINGNSFVVQGLEVNDINSRGQFTFTVEDTTALEWHNTEIQISDLQAGDTISVTYSGGVTETYPAGIENIIKIVLLDDEK
jgi:hypothetical protein